MQHGRPPPLQTPSQSRVAAAEEEECRLSDVLALADAMPTALPLGVAGEASPDSQPLARSCPPAPPQELDLSIEAMGRRLGVPAPVVDACRAELRVTALHRWQAECLLLRGVLEGRSLVYSSPTSGGKSLVAWLLVARMLATRKKKALIVLPFVSLVEEVGATLSGLLAKLKVCRTAKKKRKKGMAALPRPVRVEVCHGARHSANFDNCDVAVCTIEKAHLIVNKLVFDKQLHELGAVVVDEVHLLGDPSRGHLLELLLAKLLFAQAPPAGQGVAGADAGGAGGSSFGARDAPRGTQVVAMSATLPNAAQIAGWLHAAVKEADFRPVALKQYTFSLRGGQLEAVPAPASAGAPHGPSRGRAMVGRRLLGPLTPNDAGCLGALCAEVAHSLNGPQDVLVFCPTKKGAEGAAARVAAAFGEKGLRAPPEVQQQRVALLSELERAMWPLDLR